MSVDLETMRAKLRLDSNGFSAALGSASKEVSGFRRILSSAGATAAGFLAANVIQRGISGFTNQIGGIISAGSDMNETVSKTKVVFGESFDAINKWAKGSAAAFGLSKQEAFDTVSTYGAMALAAGVSGDAAVKFGTDLVGAAADLGSFWNFDPSQVAADIRSGLAGESEPLRKYNIYLNETAVKAKAAEMGLVGANGELTDQNKILAREALIMEQLGPAAGDYARTQTGLANSTRTLKANFKNLQAVLGAKIVPTLAKVVSWINMFIARIRRLRATGLSPLQAALKAIRIQIYQTFGRGALDVVNAIAHAIVWGFNLAKDAIGAVTDFIGRWVKVMGWAFSSGLKVSSLVYAFPKPLRQVAKGFLLIADAVGDAFHAFQKGGFSGLLKQLPDTLGQIWDGLKDIGSFALDIVIDGALKLGGDLLEWAGDLWGWVKSKLGIGQIVSGDGTGGPNSDRTITVGDVLIDAALKLAGTIDFSGIAESIRSGVVSAVGALTTIGSDVAGAIGGKITAIDWGTIVTGDSFNVGVAFGAALRSAIGSAVEVGAGIVGGFVDAVSGLTWDDVVTGVKTALVAAFAVPGALAAVGVAIASGIGGAISGLVFGEDVDFDGVVTKIQDGIQGAIDASSGWKEMLKEQGKDLLQGLQNGAGEVWGDTGEWLQGLPDKAVAWLGVVTDTLLQKGKDLLQGLWDGAVALFGSGDGDSITAWLGGLGGSVLDYISIDSNTLWNAGYNLMWGLWEGMKSVWESIKDWLGSLNPADFKGPPARDAVMLLGAGKLIMGGLSQGLDIGWNRIVDQLSGYSPEIGISRDGVGRLPTAGATATANSRGGAVNQYYVLDGAIITKDTWQTIQDAVAQGKAKTVDRRISSRRLAESY